MQLKEKSGAISDFKTSIEQDPSLDRAYFNLG